MNWVEHAHRNWHAETGQPMYRMHGQPYCPWDCAAGDDYEYDYEGEEDAQS